MLWRDYVSIVLHELSDMRGNDGSVDGRLPADQFARSVSKPCVAVEKSYTCRDKPGCAA
jgi:hypothetical protein